MQKLTMPEIAQIAYSGVVKQNGFGARWARDGNGKLLIGGCAYLSPNGMRCNVGQLITDEKYAELWDVDGGVQDLEDAAFAAGIELPWVTADEQATLEIVHRRRDADAMHEFLVTLQRIHDQAAAHSEEVGLEEGMKYYKAKMHAYCAERNITLVEPE